jgi:hypothetical protein
VLEILQDLRAKRAPFFTENPTAASVVSRLAEEDIRYVVHEFLGPTWEAFYFQEVNREMEAIGLRFAGCAGIMENFPEHSIAPDFLGRLEDCPDRLSRECMADFIQNRFFRRDVFIRPGEQRGVSDPLDDTLFGMVASPMQVPDTIKVVGGELGVKGAWFERVKHLLAYRVRSFSEIVDDQAFNLAPRADLVQGLKILTIGGFVAPFARREIEPPDGAADRIRIVPLLNEALLQRHDWAQTSRVLASPVSGTGVVLNALETAMLSALRTEDPVRWLWAEIGRRGVRLRPVKGKDGDAIEDKHEALKALDESLERFKSHKLPKLAYLGIVEPA